MPESPRIAELRRRVHADPASIAFAQLAEEYRRAGNYDDAVKYCRTGLARHPGYLSARVTLGRALVEIGELGEAAGEFELVLASAPDNLAAIRGIAEIEQRRNNLPAALEYYKRALALARFDPELEDTVNRLARELGTAGAPSARDTHTAPSAANSPGAHAVTSAPGAPIPPGEPSTPGAGLIDFDALLENLGVPDAAPPPVMEMLLTPAAAAAPALPPVVADVPVTSSAVDAFAELERELRAWDQPARELAPDAIDQAILVELEAWVRVLHRERAPLSA